MNKLFFKLFGVPKITNDGQPVFLPYSKINALLYHLLVSKVLSRDEAVGLLWPDEEDKVAKKNLRNAIYQAKKSLGVDIIISPKKSLLILNEALEIESDVDLFIRTPQENMHLYTGDFLQGFFLKDAEPYEAWVVKMRNHFREKFSAECYLKIEEDIQSKNYDQVEPRIQRLTDLDEYDERNFRLLMRFYQDTGRNSKVIETYYDLSKLLRKDLGIDPDRKTKEIYQRSLEQINFGESSYSQDESFFFGRYGEIALLEKSLLKFKERKESACVLIQGEPGVGKSTIKSKLLDEVSGDFFILEACCHLTQRDLPLRPWRGIVREIGQQLEKHTLVSPALWGDMVSKIFPDFAENLPAAPFASPPWYPPLDAMVHVLVEALERLTSQRQVLLVFEDIQWLDSESLKLLTSVLLEVSTHLVTLVATCGHERNRAMQDAISALSRRRRFVTVPLEPFSPEACHHFLEETLPGKELQGDTLEFIYNATEGNPFFLNEYLELMKRDAPLTQMSPAMAQSLQNRFLYLSDDGMELVNTLAIFYHPVSLQLLMQVTKRDVDTLLPLLEILKDRAILTEGETEQEPTFSFTHGALREYLYSVQPRSRKSTLHQTIGLLLEAELSTDKKGNKLYSKLIYHFSAAGDYLKAVQYQIDSLCHCLNFSHEMFPVLTGMEQEPESSRYISREQIDELFRNLESSLKQVRASMPDAKKLDLLELEFFYMKGRYLIREGSYEDGVESIMYVIESSQQLGDHNYTLEGYKQLILYYLQINQPKEMAEHIEVALEFAVKCNSHKEAGIILRLKGLCNMMMGNYALAEKYLTESINLFAITENVAQLYAANIAAAYNYIGEIRLAQEDYQAALQLFDTAISLCLEKNVLSSLSYFYINAGKTAYYMDNLPDAGDYFQRAYAVYGQFDSFWRRPVLDAYTALLLMRQGNYPHAREHLLSSRKNATYIKDPSDLGTVLFAEALIRRQAEQDTEIYLVFQDTLPQPAEDYCNLALSGLSEYCNCYEINTLRRMFGPQGDK